MVSNDRNVDPSTIWGILTTKTDYLTILAFLSLHPASHGKSGRCVILRQIKYAQMFPHNFVCSVHFPTVQKRTGIETVPHFYWKNGKRVKPANGIQTAFCGDFVKGHTSPNLPSWQPVLLVKVGGPLLLKNTKTSFLPLKHTAIMPLLYSVERTVGDEGRPSYA